MKKVKLINVLVDFKTHDEFKGLLKRRGRGERVKHILGDNATAKMKRILAAESMRDGE